MLEPSHHIIELIVSDSGLFTQDICRMLFLTVKWQRGVDLPHSTQDVDKQLVRLHVMVHGFHSREVPTHPTLHSSVFLTTLAVQDRMVRAAFPVSRFVLRVQYARLFQHLTSQPVNENLSISRRGAATFFAKRKPTGFILMSPLRRRSSWTHSNKLKT